MDLLKHASSNMRPHVCIPSGCQQWVSKTIAVGIDKFAYMSSLAVYVYSSITYLPLAILAKHEERLAALAMSPFDANLLACAIGNQEVRIYDVDTELLACRAKYAMPKGKVSVMEWHRMHPGVLLLAIGPALVAWDFASAAEPAGAGYVGGGSTGGSSSLGGAVPPPSPPPPSPPRSMLMRFRNPRGAAGGDGGGADPAVAGRWVTLRDVGSPVTAFDQCGAAAAAGGGAGSTLLAVATADARIVVLELEASGLVVRGELRTIPLSDAAASPSIFGGGTATSAASLTGIGPASALCWEPLSGSCLLLIVGRSGGMALYDTTAGEVILSYGKQPATATRFAQFLPSQPGNFLVSSSRSGALHLWNVSQSQPLRPFKVGGGLVQGFALLRTAAGGGGGSNNTATAARSPHRTAVLVSFTDGAVFSYDLDSQQVLWRQEGGHTETVFDCRFCTSDPNLLATASFDSTVRVWDVRTSRCVKHLLGAEGILYSVSWSADGRHLAASNDSGVIFLYDYGRGVLTKTLRQHTKQSLKVAFHPHKPSVLASASTDGTVFVYTIDGETVRVLRHSSPVSCIAWSSLVPSLVASTSEGGELLLWDVSRPPNECLVRTLVGHNGRSFNVEFSPLLRNYLLSSSNDRTSRVWDVSSGECLAVLSGHTAVVRAVAWHPEVAHICFTGSWDASVRVWDIRAGHCLHVANDHHADVYGIACHPRRPFFLATCSRDNTLRFWSTLGLTSHLLPQALIRGIPALRAPSASEGEAAVLPQSSVITTTIITALMSGSGSLELSERLAAPSCSPLEQFAAITEFFMPPACMDIFWDVARYVRYGSGGGRGGSDPGGVGGLLGNMPLRQRPAATAEGGSGGGDDVTFLQHWTAARLALGSAANHLELAAASKARLGSGAARRDELLREAAQQHLLAGNLEHCCELLAEVGDWDRALALAPVVGLPLWQRLLRQRLQAMAEAEAQSHVSDVLPLYLVSGQVPELVEILSASCLYDTAFNVAAVQASGGYPVAGSGYTSGGGARGGSGAGRERCNSAGSATSANGGGGSGGDLLPPLQRPPSPSIGSLTAHPSVAAALGALTAHPPVLERVRSSCVELSSLASMAPVGRTAAPAAANGGSSLGGASQPTPATLQPPLPPLLPPPLAGAGSALAAASATTLPPLTVRGGTLPVLHRSLSLRPPMLAPLQLSASAAAALASPSSPRNPPPLSSRPDSPPASAPFGGDAGPLPLPLVPASPPLALTPTHTVPLPAAPSSPRAPTPPTSMRLVPSPSIRQSRSAAAAAVRGGSRPTREAFERAVAVRMAQARGFMAQGLPVQAACCALTVDDVAGAVGLLLRGGLEDVALALVQGLLRPVAAAAASGGGGNGGLGPGAFGMGLESSGTGSGGGGGADAAVAVLRPRVLAAAACRHEAAGDYLTAAELLKQVPNRTDLHNLLAGRCRAHADPQTAARVFSCLGLREPGHYAAAVEAPGAVAADAAAGWEGIRRLLLGGQQAAAADRALAGVRRLLEGGERVSMLSAEWEQAWGAINSLEAAALGGPVWSRVFSHAAYLGALFSLEQGYAGVGLYLVRVLEDWVAKQPDAELPVPQSRLAAEVSEGLDECLVLPAYGSSGEVREALLELLLAPPGSAWMQGMIQSRLASVETRLSSLRTSPPTSPPSRGIRSPPYQTPGGGGAAAEGVTSPSALSSSFCANRRLGPAAAVAGSSLRLGSLELGTSSGRLAAGGGVLAAALSALQPVAIGPSGDGGGSRRRSGAAAAAAASLAELSRGPVVVAAAHVPSRSSSSMVASGGLPTSAVSGVAIRGAAVQLDDGATWLSLSEALAIRRVMSYSPLGSGRLLLLP